jgi:hypothetical protein
VIASTAILSDGPGHDLFEESDILDVGPHRWMDQRLFAGQGLQLGELKLDQHQGHAKKQKYESHGNRILI